jgi:hypothetical protein
MMARCSSKVRICKKPPLKDLGDEEEDPADVLLGAVDPAEPTAAAAESERGEASPCRVAGDTEEPKRWGGDSIGGFGVQGGTDEVEGVALGGGGCCCCCCCCCCCSANWSVAAVVDAGALSERLRNGLSGSMVAEAAGTPVAGDDDAANGCGIVAADDEPDEEKEEKKGNVWLKCVWNCICCAAACCCCRVALRAQWHSTPEYTSTPAGK